MEQLQTTEKEHLQLRKDQEAEHAQLRKSKERPNPTPNPTPTLTPTPTPTPNPNPNQEALVKGHGVETEMLRAELMEKAGLTDKALREQAERSAGEIRTKE